MLKRFLIIAAALAAALAGGAAAAAVPAGATTLTCTGSQNQALPPFGCGGAQLAYTAKGTLDLAVLGTGSSTGNYWNSPVGVLTDSQSASREDFTVFAVDGDTSDGPGSLGEYVAMYTPGGKIASFTQAGVVHTNAVPAAGRFTAGTNVYCVSVENLNDGPGHAVRWHAVLRNCNTNGTFSYGNNGQCAPAPGPVVTTACATTDNSVSAGRANQFQVWAPVSGAAGLLLVNSSLSREFRHGNTPWVLDDRSFGGSGTGALAFPENDGLNQQWSIIGCTEPVTQLNTSYALCP
ncbi:MAG: hypothetical protein KGJ86_15630 [Chloroflexota bacterium]|nr:hypothetical protein [Chloroflexota bacterium]